MKTTQTDDRYALYAAWNADRQSTAPQPLKDWMSRYPDFANDLVEWTADTPVLECAEQRPANTEGETRALAIGRQVVAEMRARYLVAPTPNTQRPTPAPALTSLLDAAKARQLTPKSLAERLNVGLSVVAKLNQRHFRFASLPAELISRLADALQVTADQVRDYLRQSPTLATGASYKSSDVPRATAQEDFSQALSSCRDMTPEQKAFWLGCRE